MKNDELILECLIKLATIEKMLITKSICTKEEYVQMMEAITKDIQEKAQKIIKEEGK